MRPRQLFSSNIFIQSILAYANLILCGSHQPLHPTKCPGVQFKHSCSRGDTEPSSSVVKGLSDPQIANFFNDNEPENLHHILAEWESLAITCVQLLGFTKRLLSQFPGIVPIVQKYCVPKGLHFIQFLLNCSVLLEVIRASQALGSGILLPLFQLTRTWCYILHKNQPRRLGCWKKI